MFSFGLDPFPTVQHTALMFVKPNRFFYCPKESFFVAAAGGGPFCQQNKTKQNKKANLCSVHNTVIGPRTNNVLIVCALACLLVLM